MNAIEELVRSYNDSIGVGECEITDNARAELSALRQRVAELERERDAARSGHDYAVAEQAKSTAYITGLLQERLQSAQAIVTPNNCRHCQRAAEKMREAAANVAEQCKTAPSPHGNDRRHVVAVGIANTIRAIPLPACEGCNPLKPDANVVYCREFKPQSQAALLDQLNELIELANMNGLYDAADFVANRK